ncbi:MAG: SAM-dependent methyltransferase [Candidatus Daviesbacteria bacterium]|nr:SAM-dependent methyltransferase [Candidatus Daviesbacteria bacterium]
MASNKFVSRGGDKLQAAIVHFQLSIINLIILDVGSSTGGFVDCLLQNGAAKIYSVDTAYGELAWKLRNDSRVVVMERTNILHLKSLPPPVILSAAKNLSQMRVPNKSGDPSLIVQDDNVEVGLITIDAGWTRLELVLPAVKKFLKPSGIIIALLKPHYELGKNLPKGGVLSKEISIQVKDQTIKKIEEIGFKIKKEMESPILGGAGNLEFLLYITFSE